jgi:hypothetical protein
VPKCGWLRLPARRFRRQNLPFPRPLKQPYCKRARHFTQTFTIICPESLVGLIHFAGLATLNYASCSFLIGTAFVDDYKHDINNDTAFAMRSLRELLSLSRSPPRYTQLSNMGSDENVETVHERRARPNSTTAVGRDNLTDAVPPHESYEGYHHYDPATSWTEKEERVVVLKTDMYLLSWLCLMVQHRYIC